MFKQAFHEKHSQKITIILSKESCLTEDILNLDYYACVHLVQTVNIIINIHSSNYLSCTFFSLLI